MNSNTMYLFELEALVSVIGENMRFLPKIQDYLSGLPISQYKIAVASSELIHYAEQLGFTEQQILLIPEAENLSSYISAHNTLTWYLFLHQFNQVEIDRAEVCATVIIVDKDDNLLPEKEYCYINQYEEVDFLF